MRTHLYTSGIGLLSAQDGQPTKLQFTGFRITSSLNIVFNPAVNTLPNIVYTGTPAEMSYSPITNDQVILQCKVDHDIAETTLAAVQLMVDNVPFSISIPTDAFVKLETHEDRAVGSKFFFRILINIPDLFDRVSFANLNMSHAVFKPVATEQALPLYPWEEKSDQLVIQRHSVTNSLVPVLNAWGDYWGNPLAMKLEGDDGFWRIDGGVAGDDHKYTG